MNKSERERQTETDRQRVR
uniref:Uncharacterized protein n=1 Tax=Anguilla anguilla TaxID=7936 RepID=A0A0E9RG26_ANGAN